MSKPCVLVVGNPSDGYRYIGPFEDFDAAAQFSEGADSDNWVATLEAPDGANLLAAAPEMLAALKDLMELYSNGQLVIEGERDEGDDPVVGAAFHAIAKAEGRG
jgi:hypothetical protein